ncbi:MAG: sigma-70 family RNA polymerase sigma factor [Myxococcales bacterium]
MVVLIPAMEFAMPQVLRAIVAGPADSTTEPEDRAIAERCLAGDREAFAILVGRHGRAVHAFCCRLVGGSLAEEIAQETLARAWTRLGEFRWESSFRSWLFRIGLNLCRDHLKSGKAREDSVSRTPGLLDSLDPSPGPEDRVLGQETARNLERALGQLPPKYREAFVLKHIENLSYQQMHENRRHGDPRAQGSGAPRAEHAQGPARPGRRRGGDPMNRLDDRIQQLLDGELTADEERALRRELASDPAAMRALAQLEGGISGLSSAAAPSLPPDFQARVMSRVAARPAPRVRLGFGDALRDLLAALAWPRLAAMATALVLVACAAGFLGYRAGARSAPTSVASAAPATPAPPATVYVRFTLTAPDARIVELAGSFNRWGEKRIALVRGTNGAWNATVELPRGRYEYAFVVDGKRFVADADAADFAEDGFGETNAVLDI